jgi:hypothetical protein
MANKAQDSSVSNCLRMTTYMPRNQLTPSETKVTANFQLNVTNQVVLTWSGRVVTISVTTLGKKQSWANDQLRVPSSGGPRLMWYGSPGGQWKVEDVVLPS